jgi:hypothetical protein
MRTIASVAALALSVSGCGGGGGGGSQSGDGAVVVPPPVLSVPPPSTPVPPPPAVPLALTALGEFTSLAWDQGYIVAADGITTTPEWLDPADRFDFRYLASQQAHEVMFPGTSNWLRLQSGVPTANPDFSLFELSPPGSIDRYQLYLFKPGAANKQIALDHTSLGYWYSDRRTPPGPGVHKSSGLFAFGVVTTGGSVPESGSASYDGYVYAGIGTGRASLDVDFLAGKGSGTFEAGAVYDPGGYESTGQIVISDYKRAPGSAAFTARLTLPGTLLTGTLDGRFTGPAAGELMARWELHEKDPATGARLIRHYGIIAGKRR